MLILRALDFEVGALHPGLVELGSGFCQIRLRRGAPLEAIAGELHCAFVGLDGLVQKLFLGVCRAQAKIVERELRVQTKAGVLQVGIAGLGLSRAAVTWRRMRPQRSIS